MYAPEAWTSHRDSFPEPPPRRSRLKEASPRPRRPKRSQIGKGVSHREAIQGRGPPGEAPVDPTSEIGSPSVPCFVGSDRLPLSQCSQCSRPGRLDRLVFHRVLVPEGTQFVAGLSRGGRDWKGGRDRTKNATAPRRERNNVSCRAGWRRSTCCGNAPWAGRRRSRTGTTSCLATAGWRRIRPPRGSRKWAMR